MSDRPGNRTHLYVLMWVFCLLLVVCLVLLYITHDPGSPGRENAPNVMASWNELSVPPEGAAKVTVPMDEIAVWEIEEQTRYPFLAGDYARTDRGGDPDVNYPDFKSDTPRFGQVRFTNGGTGSWRLHFALDHSEGKSGAYDLLCFDENCDFDLRNDTPRRVLKDPNGLPRANSAALESIWFESVKVPFYFEAQGQRLIELLPRLWLYRDREAQVSLVGAKVHKGTFEIGGQTYKAFLGYGSTISGRLDHAFSTLHLICENSTQPDLPGTSSERLNVMRSLGGRWCRFSCTPTGDRLFVYPYEGPTGILRLDAGRRDVKRLEILGDLGTREGRIVLGYTPESGASKGMSQYEIPVGDYYPGYLDVVMGNIRFALSTNTNPRISGRQHSDKNTRPIEVRQDKPFVLRFSRKPLVVFVHPERNESVSLGSEIRIEAVLLDPVLNVMIRGLGDMTQTETKTYTTPDGQKRTFEWAPSIEPRVVIKRANGEIVAEGVMPFG